VQLDNGNFALESFQRKGLMLEAVLDRTPAPMVLVDDEGSSSFCEFVVAAKKPLQMDPAE
jgi:hypothetical protein